MSSREIRSYDYVNHSYDLVRDVLKRNSKSVFQSATKAAAARAQSVAAELHVDFGGISVSTDVNLDVMDVQENEDPPSTRLTLVWEAATMPGLFPLMNGELAAYPLTSTETQLDFSGVYDPPFGAIGKTINAIALHRIADASVHRFVSDVARYLRESIT